ncbi:hypothetical protein QKP71_gp2 [Neofusicoccum luteum fusarivirus 1]|uniref:Uncharacterized protein n=1 Tax=Neofusicoccum luteum fusarivirus 1 TaxID=1985188 RepID=A0ABM6KDY5_9VIRU|nr:hypothetical protein QKP71_gp2 [Neofusicoccum luteum fusarivirus 1]ARO52689.1 hypothetical protein [Neofusicoccum luteum fusarivirus 1]
MNLSKEQNDPLESFERQLEIMKSSTVSYQGKHGFFVSKEAIDALEKSILTEMEKSESPNKLIALQDELEEIRNSSKTLQETLVSTQKQVREKNQLIIDLKKRKDEAIVQRNDSLKMISEERNKLVDQLKIATEEKKKAMLAYEKARKGFDPEVALDAEETLAGQKAMVADLQKQLELVNADKHAVSSDVAKLTAAIATLDSEKKQLESTVHSLVEAKKKSSATSVPEVTIPRPEIANKTLAKLLGKSGIEWLQKAEQQVADDYRQRVYHLMVATKGGKTANIKSISQLLETVFQWLKLQSYKLRKTLAKWVDEIESDIRAATFKSVSYYRDQLLKIREDILAERTSSTKTDKDDPMSWFDSVYYGALVFKRSISQKVKGFFTPVTRVFSYLSSLFSRRSNYKKPTVSEEDSEIFDADSYAKELRKHDEEMEKRKIKMTEVPPIPEKEEAGPSRRPPPPRKQHPSFAKVANLFGAK